MSRLCAPLLLTICLSLAGCASSEQQKPDTKPDEATAQSSLPTFPVDRLFEANTGWMPPDTFVVAVVDPDMAMQFARDTFPAGEVGDKHYRAMVEDLDALFVDQLGFSPTAADAVVFAAGQRWQVLILQGQLPHTLEQNESHQAHGLTAYKLQMKVGALEPPLDELWAVPIDEPAGIAVFANKFYFEAAAEARAGGAKTLSKGPKLDALERLFSETAGGRIAVATHIDPAIQSVVTDKLPFPSPEAAGLSLGDDIEMKVLGPKRALDGLHTLVEQNRRLAREQVTEQYDKRAQVPAPLSASVILAYHVLESYNEVFEVKRTDDSLSYRMALPQGRMNVMVLGTLTAIAVPAFIKYIKRSKASEATANLEQLRAEAVQYYAASGDDGTCEFPASAGPAPAEKSCCAFNNGQGGGKCPATAEWWDQPGWKALDFRLDDDHYFAYETVNKSTDEEDVFVIRASTDFVCGGPKHIVEIVIKGSKNANGNCQAKASHPITYNEFE